MLKDLCCSLAPMLSTAFKSASTYFYLPIDEEESDVPSTSSRHKSWTSSWSSDFDATPSCSPAPSTEKRTAIDEVLSHNDLYEVLGVPRSKKSIDKLALRRAYLARSRSCHPDKFPNNPEATRAFQKVCVAYDVLSKPHSKRLYDSCPTPQDFFHARPPGYAEQTFRGVVIGVFNDFLDGDLEMVRTLLKAINDINPSIRLGDEGVNAVMSTLQNIRERALTCRTCILALHSELSRILEVQHAFGQLSYFDLMGRSRLTIQLARITLSLPMAIEKAIQDQEDIYGHDQKNDKAIMPRRVSKLIRGVVLVLERMERILK